MTNFCFYLSPSIHEKDIYTTAEISSKFESKLKRIKLGSNLAENSAEISAKFESKLKRIKLGSKLAENSAKISAKFESKLKCIKLGSNLAENSMQILYKELKNNLWRHGRILS